MKEEDIMKALAQAARESDVGTRLDRRWDALSAGELSAEDIEALRKEAAQDEDLAQAFEAFRPLDATFRTDVVERIQQQLQDAGTVPANDDEAPAGTIPFPRRKRPVWMPAAMAAAVVSAVMVSFVLQPVGEPLPEYGAQLRGGATMRSDPAPSDLPVFESGDRFELVLTPATSVEEDLSVELYVDIDGGLQRIEAPAAEVSPFGAARVVGRIGSDIMLPAGEHDIVAVVGRADRLPSTAELTRRLGEGSEVQTRSWSAWRMPLQAY